MQEGELYQIFKKIIAVTLTDYFPRKKCIKPRFCFQPFYIIRDTTHFTLNTVARDLSTIQTGGQGDANWSSKKFAVLCPFDALYARNGKNLQTFNPEDTFFTRVVFLPPGTIVLVMPEGIDQAIKEDITTQAEVTQFFQEYTGPKEVQQRYFEKTIEGIRYRIYNWHLYVRVKEEAMRLIHELGYNFGVPDALLISLDILNLPTITHDLHWTKGLERFSGDIYRGKEKVMDLLAFLAKMEELDIVLPTRFIEFGDMRYGFPNQYDKEKVEKIIDANDHVFYPDLLNSFSLAELNGAYVYSVSVTHKVGEDSHCTLLGPIVRGKTLLRTPSIPQTYHKTIILYVKEYQKFIREHVPMSVMVLMPGLQEAISDTFLFA